VTAKMNVALSYLKRARENDPNTDDGVLTNEGTFYDSEVAVAFVHWRTARALVDAGLARYGDYDPDGTALVLSRAEVSQEPPS
jgi:hypothetical protein